MKISNSKKQLAKIISENGGWREGAKMAAQQKIVMSVEFWTTPGGLSRVKGEWIGRGHMGDRAKFLCDKMMPNHHQTTLSRDEYFHLYPAPDAGGWIKWERGECPVAGLSVVDVKYFDVEGFITGIALDFVWGPKTNIAYYRKTEKAETGYPDGVKPTDPAKVEGGSRPTIEQLAAEYRNRQDYAERKQQEADAAKAEAEAKLAELVAAGKAVGLVVSVAAPEQEMVITDWRDLLVGDVVAITSVFGRDNSGYEHLIDREAVVVAVGNTEFQELVVDSHGIEAHIDGFRFIRRPAKEADNA